MRFGPLELGVVAVIVLFIVGPKKIPELARGIGQGIKEFKFATKDEPQE